MYKKMMVAIDDSHTAYLALQEAIALAKVHQATICLVNVIDEKIFFYEGFPVEYNELVASLKKESDKILSEAEEIVKQANVPYECQSVEMKKGRTADKIVDASQDWKADLLVIGTHGKHGFNRLVLGSVAEGVIRQAIVPVLLVRGKEE